MTTRTPSVYVRGHVMTPPPGDGSTSSEEEEYLPPPPCPKGGRGGRGGGKGKGKGRGRGRSGRGRPWRQRRWPWTCQCKWASIPKLVLFDDFHLQYWWYDSDLARNFIVQITKFPHSLPCDLYHQCGQHHKPSSFGCKSHYIFMHMYHLIWLSRWNLK